MKVMVANIGSTSYKWRLYDMDGEKPLAEGRTERIGEEGGCPDYGTAIAASLDGIVGEGRPLKALAELGAVGFKTVHARGITGCRIVDEAVLRAMEEYFLLLPAHNPPYVSAIRAFAQAAPGIPLVALFETAFYRDLEEYVYTYAVPLSWRDTEGVRKYGFHGASHRWASERARALCSKPGLRHISCHLGGSSSVTAVRDGVAVNTSMGMTPQCGLLQGTRVGDVDVFAVLYVMKKRGLSVDEIAKVLGAESGLAGLSGVGSDIRDIEMAAEQGKLRAKLALDVFVYDVRRYLGAFMVQLGGVDVITFSGGIGEKDPMVRARVMDGLGEFGIRMDSQRNEARGKEARISADDSRVEVWTLITNEELIVARAAAEAVSATR
jgi:acetate kinase